jgi:hypothetical protein
MADQYCDSMSHTCALPAISAVGAVCGLLPDGTHARCDNGVACVASAAGATSGTCMAYLTDGAVCQLGYGVPFCFSPAACVADPWASQATCRVVGGDICG